MSPIEGLGRYRSIDEQRARGRWAPGRPFQREEEEEEEEERV
jgi:hypothetical protein